MAPEQSIERVLPDDVAGRLVEAEHFARYAWAARLAAGRDVLDAGCGTGYGARSLAAAGARSVLGVDISDEAIAQARAVETKGGPRFEVADLRALPYADESFDLIVCFEVIEHLAEQDEVLAELKRVLRSDGVLALSSPNRNVYPPGNEYHVHEFTPAELEGALRRRFAQVALHRQHPLLATVIVDDASFEALASGAELTVETHGTRRLPREEMFTIALASDRDLASVPAISTLAPGFELKWWHEQLSELSRRTEDIEAESRRIWATKQEVDKLLHAANLDAARAREQAHAAGQRIIELEHHLAASIADAEALRTQLALRETELQGQLEERQRELEAAKALAERGYRIIEDIKRSPSWKLTSPLRAVKRMLKG